MTLIDRISDLLWPGRHRRPAPSPLAAALSQARAAFHAEDYDTALQRYAAALAMPVAAGDALAQLDGQLQQVEVLLAVGRLADAQAALDEAEALAEAQGARAGSAFALIVRGDLLLRRGDVRGAEQAYDHARAIARAARAPAPQGRATMRLGALALREDNPAFAIHLLREAIPLLQASLDVETLTEALGHLGAALIASDQHAQGRQVINNAIENGLKHQQIAVLRRLNLDAGRFAMDAGDYHAASAYFVNALRLFPYPQRSPDLYLEAHLMAAYTTYQDGRSADAQPLLEKAYALQAALPDRTLFPTLQAVEALLLAQTDQTERAAALLESALQQETIVVREVAREAWIALADVHQRMLRFEEALTALERARASQKGGTSPPNQMPYDEFYIQTCIAYIRRCMPNQRPAAIADYQEMLRLAEQRGNPDEQALPLAHISVLEGELGMGPRVLRRIERALLVNSRNDLVTGPILQAAALVHYDYGDLETAEGLARKALDYVSEHSAPFVQGTLALLLLTRGQPEAALGAVHAAEAAPLAQTDPAMLSRLRARKSQAYLALGNPTLALQYAQEALSAVQQPQRQPEETATACQVLGHAQIAMGDHAAGRQTLRDARAHAQRSDFQLQIWEITLQLADALLPYAADEADALLAEVREAIAVAESRRLLVLLHAVESKLAAHSGDLAAARQHWQAANHHRQLAQLPPTDAPWLMFHE